MIVEDIFVVINESLYAVKWHQADCHELQRIFDDWNDVEYLYAFFKEHKSDLQGGFYMEDIPDAIRKTRKEAKAFKRQLFDFAQGTQGNGTFLSDLFKPLSKKDLLSDGYERDKAYGPANSSWLRLYAIRININVYVVTGGAIKLTKKMDRPHLEKELEKLDITKDYLEDLENPDSDIFYELSL